MWRSKMLSIPSADKALPGRSEPSYDYAPKHYVNGQRIDGVCPESLSEVFVGMGCFWGAERKFWNLEGVYATTVGYGGGHTPHPTYDEVCTGMTGHNELVRIWYDPEVLSLSDVLAVFWENHNPTQGMRQGNDIGTQYRSGIYVNNEHDFEIAELTMEHYQSRLFSSGLGNITTEIVQGITFYPAEIYHQQYLAKNPDGYCGLGGCNVAFLA